MKTAQGELIISSYFPLYRTPPPPLEAISWGCTDLRLFGFEHNREQSWDLREKPGRYFSVWNNKMSARVLEAAAIKYCKNRPELITYDDDLWKKAFAKNMLYIFHNGWSYRGSKASEAMTGITIDFPAGPDDQLNFNYMAASVRCIPQKLVALMRAEKALLELHIKKRYSDSRYRYFHRRAFRDPEYWLNPNNWTGFKAGFVIDFFFCRLVKSVSRYEVFRMPIQVRQESRIQDVIQFDPVFRQMFCIDDVFRNNLARMLIATKRTWENDVLNRPLPAEIDKLFTITLERHRNGQSQPAQGPLGTILQAGRGIQIDPGNWCIQGFSNIAAQARYAATAPEPELPESITTGMLEGRIAELNPTVEVRHVPVYRDDGAIIGTRPVAVDAEQPGLAGGIYREPGTEPQAQAPTPEQITEALRQIRGELDDLARRGTAGDTAAGPG